MDDTGAAREGDNLEERLKSMGSTPPDQDPEDYAPPATRVEVMLQEDGKKLQAQIERVIDEVAASVTKEITAMRKELDDLEVITARSCGAAKGALTNHLAIAAQSMESCHRIREQIASFKETIADTLPKSAATGS